MNNPNLPLEYAYDGGQGMKTYTLKNGEMLFTEQKVITEYRSIVLNKKNGATVKEGKWAKDKFTAYDLFLEEFGEGSDEEAY